jgi:hypothetical protein
MAFVGISELARQLKVGKGTLSKQAAAGKLPIADRDGNGHPLFDIEAVRQAREQNLNPLMKRTKEITPPAAGADDVMVGPGTAGDGLPERRSVGPRPPSALVEQQKLEKQLKNRRLFRQIGEDEGLFILRREAEETSTTMARQTRDGVTAQLADFASKLYAFVGQQARSEAELRVWLAEHAGAAFDEVEKAIATEQGDEFDNDGSESPDTGVEPGTAAAA